MLSGEGVATGCSSGTFIGGIDLSAESTLGTSAINSAQQYGQSFKLPDSAGIYSVLFGVNSPVTTSGDFEIRICATADCTSYLATTGIIEISVAGWQEFVLTTHPVLMSDTTYYIAIAPVSTGSIDIKRLTNDYVDGARGYHIGAGFGTLTMTTGDLQFGVKICA